MSILRLTFHGISWSIAQRWVIRGLTFIRLAILARILLPQQFGIVSVATIVLGFLEIVTETWINVFLVQEKDKIDKYIDTAWIVSILRGVIISSLILIYSDPIAIFFNSPQSSIVLKLVSFVPLVRGFINPAVAVLQKDLKFFQEFVFKSLLFTIEAISAIIICSITKNASGIIWGMIISAFVEVIFSLIFFRPIPRFKITNSVLSKILHQGKWITMAGIFNFAYQHGDDIVVGRFLGETGLGLYDPIYKISGLPVSEISDVVAKVSFPMYVKIRENSVLLKKYFTNTLLITSGITTIIGALLIIFASPLILIILGPNWLPASQALQILCLYGISKAIISSIYPLFLATKHQEYVTYISLLSFILLILTIVPLVQKFGLVGAGISATLGSLGALPLSFLYVRKIFLVKK